MTSRPQFLKTSRECAANSFAMRFESIGTFTVPFRVWDESKHEEARRRILRGDLCLEYLNLSGGEEVRAPSSIGTGIPADYDGARLAADSSSWANRVLSGFNSITGLWE
jgi:hypothetical protein